MNIIGIHVYLYITEAMDRDYWKKRWRDGNTGWHANRVHPTLVSMYEQFNLSDHYHFLLPLCGKSFDIDWLFLKGHAVTGIETATEPIFEVAKRLGIDWSMDQIGPFTRYNYDNLQIFQGDFFALKELSFYNIDVVFDRGAFVAIDPSKRQAYADIYKWMRPKKIGMVLRMREIHEDQDGPPFSFVDQELNSYLTDRFDIKDFYEPSIEEDQNPDRYPKAQFWLTLRD